jgi:hypothetical protein
VVLSLDDDFSQGARRALPQELLLCKGQEAVNRILWISTLGQEPGLLSTTFLLFSTNNTALRFKKLECPARTKKNVGLAFLSVF